MYGALNSPLPGLTVSPNGCRACGMRGLGQDEGDPSSPDLTYTGLPGGDTIVPEITAPDFVLDPNMPAPEQVVPNLPTSDAGQPAQIGSNFISVGGGNYLNLQTGQTVPQSIAEEITAASTGPATANLQPTSTDVTGSLVAPTAPGVSTVNLSAAAQALSAAGQLIDATGKLTAQGQALAASGNLYGTAAQASTTQGLSAAVQSLGNFLNAQSLIPGVSNLEVGAIAVIGMIVFISLSGSGKRRRR